MCKSMRNEDTNSKPISEKETVMEDLWNIYGRFMDTLWTRYFLIPQDSDKRYWWRWGRGRIEGYYFNNKIKGWLLIEGWGVMEGCFFGPVKIYIIALYYDKGMYYLASCTTWWMRLSTTASSRFSSVAQQRTAASFTGHCHGQIRGCPQPYSTTAHGPNIINQKIQHHLTRSTLNLQPFVHSEQIWWKIVLFGHR